MRPMAATAYCTLPKTFAAHSRNPFCEGQATRCCRSIWCGKARVTLRTTRALKLIRLAGSGLARLGATAEVSHGGLPYDVAQAWSKALRDHPCQPDGLAYRSRHDDDAICYALFDRAPPPVEEVSRETDLDAKDWFWREVDRYGVGIAPY